MVEGAVKNGEGYPTLEDYRKQIKRKECHYCNCSTLNKEPISMYPHDAGWPVSGPVKQWLYIQCPECGYPWALWKLGVPRA